MNKTIRNITLVIILLSFLYVCFGYVTKKAEREAMQKMHVLLNDSVEYYRNNQNDLIAQIQTVEVEKNKLADLLEYSNIDKGKLKAQVRKLSRIVSYHQATAKVQDTVYIATTDTVIVDSSGNKQKAYAFNYTDNYLKVDSGLFVPELEKITLPYQYHIDFNVVTYYKKDGLFKSPEMVTDITFPHKKVVPMTATSIQTKVKKKFYEKLWFQAGIGLAVGVLIAK